MEKVQSTQEVTSREEEERKLLENISKRKKGKPEHRERHGANTWRHWVEGEDDE